MGYEYDIFVSYRRTAAVGRWVQRHLVPLLEQRVNERSAYQVRIFCDFNMADGVNLPAELKSKICGSGLLLAAWSADYFCSGWCMAEWQSFKKREQMLGLFSDCHPQGPIYPVRYADGEYFHPDAQLALCRKDFSRLNYAVDAFALSVKWLDFDALVTEMAEELVHRLAEVPDWSDQFPIVEPPPLAAASLKRPVI